MDGVLYTEGTHDWIATPAEHKMWVYFIDFCMLKAHICVFPSLII